MPLALGLPSTFLSCSLGLKAMCLWTCWPEARTHTPKNRSDFKTMKHGENHCGSPSQKTCGHCPSLPKHGRHRFAHAIGLGINHSTNHLFVLDGSTWPHATSEWLPSTVSSTHISLKESTVAVTVSPISRTPWEEHHRSRLATICARHVSPQTATYLYQPGIDFLHHRIWWILGRGNQPAFAFGPFQNCGYLRSNQRDGSLYTGLKNSCFHISSQKTTLPQHANFDPYIAASGTPTWVRGLFTHTSF